MSVVNHVRPGAEENAIDRQIERDAQEIVWDRWMADPAQIGELMREWLSDISDEQLRDMAVLALERRHYREIDDDLELARILKKRLRKASRAALRHSNEVHEESDFLFWARRNGL